MRGGTSKGVFLHVRDVPPPGPRRDALVLDLMGSPDPMQIDGLGGTYSSTSKVMVVEREPGGPVHYWFGQVGVDSPTVDWSGNCGNLTTAVAAFAVDEGLVEVTEPVTRVSLRNGNTGVRVDAEVPVEHGRAAVHGEQVVPGVPRSGAPIATHYLEPGGSVTGRLLPTGRVLDEIEIDGRRVGATLLDVTSAFVLVRAADLGVVPGGSTVAELNADRDLLGRIEWARGQAARLIGVVTDAGAAVTSSPVVPRIVLVSPPREAAADLDVIGVSMGVVHRALPMTAALCLAGAVRIPGTVAHACALRSGNPLRLRHPLGCVEVLSEVGTDADGHSSVRSVGVVRTARRLMEGTAYPYADETEDGGGQR
jgi:2-methylaconitate cis-trans-isomerase PrpF